MTTEGGTSLAKLADFLGTDRKTGIQVKADPGEVRIVIDSMAWPSESIDMDPDDIDEFIELLRKRQAEARQ
jgi:hypothetical protein